MIFFFMDFKILIILKLKVERVDGGFVLLF